MNLENILFVVLFTLLIIIFIVLFFEFPSEWNLNEKKVILVHSIIGLCLSVVNLIQSYLTEFEGLFDSLEICLCYLIVWFILLFYSIYEMKSDDPLPFKEEKAVFKIRKCDNNLTNNSEINNEEISNFGRTCIKFGKDCVIVCSSDISNEGNYTLYCSKSDENVYICYEVIADKNVKWVTIIERLWLSICAFGFLWLPFGFLTADPNRPIYGSLSWLIVFFFALIMRRLIVGKYGTFSIFLRFFLDILIVFCVILLHCINM